MEKVLVFREAGGQTRKNYTGHLTVKVTRPNKLEAVKAFVSRFGKAVEPVGRPEGTEGVEVPTRIILKEKR